MHYITLQIKRPRGYDYEMLTGIREELAVFVAALFNCRVKFTLYIQDKPNMPLVLRLEVDCVPPDARERLRKALMDVYDLDVTAVTVVDADMQMRMEG